MYKYLTRRRFVSAGIAVGAAASVAAAASMSGGSHNDPLGLQLPLHLAIFDTRFPASLTFARTFAVRGVTLAPYDGDVTPVWFEELHPVWRQYPIAVAGLTTEGALFCLEQLAWDNGMRVAYRGFHYASPDGGMEHLLQSPAGRPQDVAGRLAGAEPWPAQVAELIANIAAPAPAFPSNPRARSQATCHTRSGATAATGRLVSWLIAPKKWRSPAAAETTN